MTRTAPSLALLCCLLLSPALADEVGPEPGALQTSGSIKALKSEGFFELRHRVPVPGKRRLRSVKSYLKVSGETAWFGDLPSSSGRLQKGTQVWLFGEPKVSESVTDTGQRVVERQVRGTQAVVFGAGLSLQASKAKQGARWIQASVTKAGPALEVDFEGQSYRVLCVRRCSFVERKALDKAPSKLKKALVEIAAKPTSELPAKPKAKRLSYAAKRVVLLNKRLQAAYRLMQRS